MSPAPAISRLEGLNGLRALAALAVFAVHYNQTVRFDGELGPFQLARLLPNGEHGVSLFFALSGFLLALPFWRALGAGHRLPGLGAYAMHRAARILPAYYLLLTLLVVLGGMWRIPGAWADIALHYLFLFNFAEFSIFSINAPFWTLAVEVQFYVLLPVLFLLLARVKAGWRVPLVVVLGAVAYAGHYWLVSGFIQIVPWPLDPRLVWIRPFGAVLNHSLLAHLPHFLLGILAARWLLGQASVSKEAGTPRRKTAHELVFWSALVLVLVCVGTPLEETIQVPFGRYGLPVVPILLTAMIATAPSTRLARRCLELPPLRGLGTISYGFYIYHLPCLLLVDRMLAQRGIDAVEHAFSYGAAALALALAVSAVSYGVIERPVMTAARKLA